MLYRSLPAADNEIITERNPNLFGGIYNMFGIFRNFKKPDRKFEERQLHLPLVNFIIFH